MSIQTVLAGSGIPTYPGSWVASYDGEMPPAQYIVHTYARAPDAASDDLVTDCEVYVYASLWSKTDPATAATTVRAAALAAGWGMVDERGAEYESDSKMYRVSWTFLFTEAV